MIKLVTLLKRRPTMTRGEFEDRWLNVHAPMAAVFPGLRGYVLSFSIQPGEPDADGVAQLWFDDRAGAQRSYASEVGRNGSHDASSNLSRRDHLLVSERWAGAPETQSAKSYKLMIGYRRAEGTHRAEFVEFFRGLDAEMLQSALGSQVVRLCVDEAGQQLNSGVEGNLELIHRDAVFDGIVEAWYDDEAAVVAARDNFAGSTADRILADASVSSETFLLRENVIVSPPEEIQPARLLAG